MKKLLAISILLFSIMIFLAGCSQVSNVKINDGNAFTSVSGNSSKRYVYLKKGKHITQTKTAQNKFTFEVPLSSEKQKIKLSSNRKFNSYKEITIKKNKPLKSWYQFVPKYNNDRYQYTALIPDKYENYDNGEYLIKLNKVNFRVTLSEGYLMSFELENNGASAKNFSGIVQSVMMSLHNDTYAVHDIIGAVHSGKDSSFRTKSYHFNGIHYYVISTIGTTYVTGRHD